MTAAADLDAFLRHRDDVPGPCQAALISSIGRLRASQDPVVTFAALPEVCVPAFADGCQVTLPGVQVTRPDDSVCPAQVLSTPFRVTPRMGYPVCAGVVTHWWTDRVPTESDAVIADLTVRHVVALVDHERLMAAVAQAEGQAADLALRAISGRGINLAIGIVMHQKGLTPDEAEDLLRRRARATGTSLDQVATSVVRSASASASASGEGHW
jgi:hypothetical protein